MSIPIDLGPDEEKALLEQARRSGRDLPAYIREILRGQLLDSGEAELTLEDLIDRDAVADCEREADDSITLEEVRGATSGIEDSMARVVIEDERAERS